MLDTFCNFNLGYFKAKAIQYRNLFKHGVYQKTYHIKLYIAVIITEVLYTSVHVNDSHLHPRLKSRQTQSR
jgi:hypothetical protein